MLKFYLSTKHPLALESNDYLYPRGAKHDNNKRKEFNEKLRAFPGSVLDLGCAGGGFVKDCIDEGRNAVGLEGSDWCKVHKLFEWSTIPDNLFTCDITKPFIVYVTDTSAAYKFDLITLSEVFEHIHYKDHEQLMRNIAVHLKSSGLVFATISTSHDFNPEFPNIEMHVVRQKRAWWSRRFEEYGFKELPMIVEYMGDKWLRQSKSNHKFVLRLK